MSTQALPLSGNCLNAVQQLTGIQEGERYTAAIPKALSGLVLKVGVAALALIETIARLIFLVGGTLLQSCLARETLAQMKRATASAAQTATDALGSLVRFRSAAKSQEVRLSGWPSAVLNQIQPLNRLKSHALAYANSHRLMLTAIGLAALSLTVDRRSSKPVHWQYLRGLIAAPLCCLGGYVLSHTLSTASDKVQSMPHQLRSWYAIDLLRTRMMQYKINQAERLTILQIKGKLITRVIGIILRTGLVYFTRTMKISNRLGFLYVMLPTLWPIASQSLQYQRKTDQINFFPISKGLHTTFEHVIFLLALKRIGLHGFACMQIGYRLHEWFFFHIPNSHEQQNYLTQFNRISKFLIKN